MPIINSPTQESLKHAVTGGIIYGTIVAYVQYRYSSSITSILMAGVTQFGTTFLNGSVNLRLYNLMKNKVYKRTENLTLSKGVGGAISGLETFVIVGGAHALNQTSGALYIASGLALISALATPTLYEKILEGERNMR